VTERDDIERLRDEVEQFFEGLWHGPRFAGARRGFRPAVDVFRTDDPRELNIVVDLAGVDPDALHVVLLERTLVIAGERPRGQASCPRSYYHLEISYGQFERRITFPESVDVSAARASYERGLLTVVLPVADAPARGVKAAIPIRRQS
jgi:HSP20 family protein